VGDTWDLGDTVPVRWDRAVWQEGDVEGAPIVFYFEFASDGGVLRQVELTGSDETPIAAASRTEIREAQGRKRQGKTPQMAAYRAQFGAVAGPSRLKGLKRREAAGARALTAPSERGFDRRFGPSLKDSSRIWDESFMECPEGNQRGLPLRSAPCTASGAGSGLVGLGARPEVPQHFWASSGGGRARGRQGCASPTSGRP
jgi:hypothetical protein